MPRDLFPFLTQGRHAPDASLKKWTRSEQFMDDVKDIANATTDHKIRSIPDPWGRPLSFATAVFEVEYPLHAVAKNQWRSLLTRLAFAGRKVEKWEIQEIPLTNTDIGISRVLKLMKPKVSYVYKTS